jgi:hypothetical protein
MKIVVFDLDETLGYFTELGIFWDSLAHYMKIKQKPELNQSDFNAILDLFPEFLRPNIINILNYLKTKKASSCCHKIMIYTNNTGPSTWANHIIEYFESKTGCKIIDQIIAAFKINGQNVEICRTTHNKTHDDLIRCTKIPSNAEICYLDDTFYPEMANDNIYYINIKPYYYDLKFDYMIEKFLESEVGKKLIKGDTGFEPKIMEQIKLYKHKYIEKDLKEYEVDKILGKHIIRHLQEFFKPKRNKTIRKKTKSNIKNNKTRRNN